MSHAGAIHVLRFLDDATLVSGGVDGRVLSWDLATGASRALCRCAGAVRDIAVDVASRRAAVVAGRQLLVGELHALDRATTRPFEGLSAAALLEGGEVVVA